VQAALQYAGLRNVITGTKGKTVRVVIDLAEGLFD
jgi:hypothetical protein